MRDINWVVKIRDIDAGTTNATWGIYLDGAEYLFKWSVKPISGYTDGLLLDKWSTGFSKKVDIKRYGRYASIGGGSISVDNTNGFYVWMKENNIEVTGKRIELIEIDTGTTTETILYTGVIGQGISHDAGTIKLPYEDITRYRNAKITSAISGKDNQYYPAVFGQVEKTKFVNEIDSVTEISFSGSELLTFRVEVPDTSDDYVGVRFGFMPSKSTFDATDLDYITDVIDAGNCYVKAVSGAGEDVIRKVDSFVSASFGSPITITLALQESIYVDENTSEWDDVADTYVKFYNIQYTNSADNWSNIQGFQDDFLYTYPSNAYYTIPNLNGTFIKTANDITLIADDLTDFGKVSGYYQAVPTAVTAGNSAITSPSDFYDFTVGAYTTWYYYSGSNAWASLSGLTDNTISNDVADVYDKDYSTLYEVDIFSSGTVTFKIVSAFEMEFDDLDADEVYLVAGVEANSLGTNLIGDCNVRVIDLNEFNSTGTTLASFIYGGATPTTQAKRFENFDQDIISNYTPVTQYDTNRTFWRNTDENAVGLIDYSTGFDALKLDVTTNPLTKKLNKLYIAIDSAHSSSGTNNWGYQGIRELGFLLKKSDIDITKGIYAKWWGRNYADTFGNGTANDLMTYSYDIYHHICRLQNYTTSDIDEPTGSEWGLVYIDTTSEYSEVIDENNTYGGLDYDSANSPLVKRQVNKAIDLDTKKLKETLLKDVWAFGCIDGDGKEKLYPMADAFATGRTRATITYRDYKGNPTLKDRPQNDIYCEPYVLYNWDEASQKYQDEIRITNTDKPTFDSTYVTGDISAAQKEAVWDRAKELREEYKVVNEPPESICKCPWQYSSTEAGLYLQKWLEWQGGTGSGFADRREVNFTVSYEFAVDNSLDVGKLISIEIPFDDAVENSLGVVTGINHNLKQSNPECKVTAYIETSIQVLAGEVDESGARADDIDESGARSDNVAESGSW